MKMYKFRNGDTVTAADGETKIYGRVIGFGSARDTNYYKILSRGEVYNCGEGEIELVSRRHPHLWDQTHLDWYDTETVLPEDIMDVDGKKFLIVYDKDIEWDVVPEVKVARYVSKDKDDPAGFIVGEGLNTELYWADEVICWALWKYPKCTEGGGDHDESSDSDR